VLAPGNDLPSGTRLQTSIGQGKIAMGRTIVWLALLGAVGSSTGCKMGQAPYDYTGPVYQDGYQTGNFYYRRGSILGPSEPITTSPGALKSDPQPTVAPLTDPPPTIAPLTDPSPTVAPLTDPTPVDGAAPNP
jgi:hypothetical protein